MVISIGGWRRINDLQIIELYFQRSEEAIKETQSKYGSLCFRVAHNILGNNEDAEECVNDAYLSVWNAVPPTRPNDLRAFVCGIVRNLSLMRYKYDHAKKRDRYSLVPLSDIEETADNSRSISDEDIGKLISDFLRKQDPDARNIFIRKYWFCDPIDDIASDYSFSKSKVKSMLFRTRNKLKKYLKEEGINI